VGSTPTWFDEHAAKWVDAGLISPGQATELKAFERAADEGRPADAGRPARLGPIAEAAAYVGVVLSLVGGVIGLAPHWDDLSLAVALVIPVSVAIAGFVTGGWLTRIGEAGADRLGSFLQLLGTAGVALASAVLVNELDPADGNWIALAAAVPTMVIGIALWRNLDRPLQFLTGVAGSCGVVVSVTALLGLATWSTGIVLWLLAVAGWIATVRWAVRPLVLARCAAGGLAVVGALMLAELNERVGSIAAMATATSLVYLALRDKMTAVLIVGVAGSVLAMQMLLRTTFRGAGAAAALAVAGLVTVVAIVWRARRSSA
jgi:hypothetical protein